MPLPFFDNAFTCSNKISARRQFLSMRLSDMVVDGKPNGLVPVHDGCIRRHRCKDGSQIYSEISEHAILCEGKEAIIVIARDIVASPDAAKPARRNEAVLTTVRRRLRCWNAMRCCKQARRR
jgi:hypothetical protein